MKIRKYVAMALCATVAASMAACGNSNDTQKETQPAAANNTADATTADSTADNTADNTSDATNGDLSGTIVITGSTSVEKILNDMKDEFEALNPDVKIQYTGSGSSAGIKDTLNKVNNIGASSRDLKDDELVDGLQQEVFAYDGIAVIVNPANEAITDITEEQLADIYSGKITNWSELGGNDAEIFVVSREASSGTRSAFEELIGLEDAGGLTENAATSEGNGPVQAAVAENENAIGYVSFSFIDDTVKPLTIGGVEATAENAKSGAYALSRPFLFCYFDDSVTDAGKAFLEFALSQQAQDIVTSHGGITVTE
jgi:phosphate transport system substrate-binding protein